MNNLAIAHTAFDYFSQGLASGEWQNFLEMLTEDFTFSFPIEPFMGNNVGKEKAEIFFNYVSRVFATGLFLTVERVTNNDTTVVFEVESQGFMFGKPYNNRAAISFDVRDNLICGYREYLSVIYRNY